MQGKVKMGFFLTVLYLVTSYLTPAVLFGPLAQYRIELILAALVLLVSMPKMTRSFAFRTPQALALAGLSVAVFISMLVALHWMGEQSMQSSGLSRAFMHIS